MESIILEIKNIVKSFGRTEVLKDLDLEVKQGDFVTILGPSGCGKTTLLRIIAGLEQPDRGTVWLEGQDVTHFPPEGRNVNMVFQNYALFPYMNVEQNIGYGLKIKKLPKAEISEKVSRMLSLVQLEGYGKRMPSELSGGQRQRVAIARALVNEPKVLLLDEPLGALDLQLRRMMQQELKHLQKKLGTTFVYITHDQEEAINMSDVIVVMKEGKVEQKGTPNEIYYHPRSAYVASFVGNANVLRGTFERVDGESRISIAGVSMPVQIPIQMPENFPDDERESVRPDTVKPDTAKGELVEIAIRSESMKLSDDNRGIPAVVTEKTFVGGLLRMKLILEDGQRVEVSSHGIDSIYKEQDQVHILWEENMAVLLEKQTGEDQHEE